MAKEFIVTCYTNTMFFGGSNGEISSDQGSFTVTIDTKKDDMTIEEAAQEFSEMLQDSTFIGRDPNKNETGIHCFKTSTIVEFVVKEKEQPKGEK